MKMKLQKQLSHRYLDDDDGGGDGNEEGLEDNCVDIFYRTFVLTVNGSVTWFLIHCQVPKFNG